MHRPGHIGAALLAYAPLAAVALAVDAVGLAIVGGVATVWLSTLPDVDHRLPLVEHRGATHTFLFALVVGAVPTILVFLATASRPTEARAALTAFTFCTVTGALVSHIAADALTPMGITPFTPFSERHITYDVTPAASPIANYLMLALGVFTTVAVVVLVLNLTAFRV